MTAPGSGAVIVLIGPPSAGKSSVGTLLAAELGVPFADTDDLVAAAAGKPVGDIFVDDGEQVFRELERAAVARGLESAGASGVSSPDGGVLALGSGAVLDPDVRRMITGRRSSSIARSIPRGLPGITTRGRSMPIRFATAAKPASR